jgi:hypothetical protein
MAHNSGNIGDDIQTIAAMRFYPKPASFAYRDNLGSLKQSGRIICNADYSSDNWIPGEQIDALMTSVRIQGRAREYVLENKEKLAKHAPIGCRDFETSKFLMDVGIRSFHSSCLTLTFEPNWKRRNGVYFVDCKVPEAVTEKVNPSKRMEAAHGYLHLYATAKLVITARIHAALPCIAFRTPVVYVHGNGELDGSISDFMDFVPHTTIRDMLNMDMYDLQVFGNTADFDNFLIHCDRQEMIDECKKWANK